MPFTVFITLIAAVIAAAAATIWLLLGFGMSYTSLAVGALAATMLVQLWLARR